MFKHGDPNGAHYVQQQFNDKLNSIFTWRAAHFGTAVGLGHMPTAFIFSNNVKACDLGHML